MATGINGPAGGVVGVTQRLGSGSAFAAKVKAAAGKKMAPRIQHLADDAAARANVYIAENFESRTGQRHKDGPHLHGSITATVHGADTRAGNPGFPFTIILSSDVDPRKLGALNYGARPHDITPRTKPFLWFPATGVGQSVASARRKYHAPTTAPPGQRIARSARFVKSSAAKSQATKQGSMVKSFLVHHPGQVASYFMELSLSGAVQATLRKSVHLPRP